MKEPIRNDSKHKQKTFLRHIKLILFFLLLINSLSVLAQSDMRIKGIVVSEMDSEPLIGVNVVQRGTTNGVITDYNGAYELTVPVGAEVEFSYIGFIGKHITVTTGKIEYNINLLEDNQSLDEVVIIGYGVQKKKLLTGATVQVSGDNIQKLSTTSALSALQSQTPGVNITQNSGQPGEGFKVTIRGLGTVGSSSPLYVIDGIAGFDINILNPSDIESVDVLKDAASAAIYGARAANGVVLVTTKQGKTGKIQVSYDGFLGWQNVYKMPSLLNAQEYMTIQDEIQFNEGNTGYDWANRLPSALYNDIRSGKWNGTNWLEEARVQNAPVQNHAFNLTGGNDISKFSMGFSYANQEGVLGKPANPFYERYTARINSDHVILKGDDRDIIKIGQNLNFSHYSRTGIQMGNIYWNDIHNMLVGNPLLPMYNAQGGYYDQNDKTREGWIFDGKAASPIADMALGSHGQNLSKSYALQANAYLEIQPIKNLKFRSMFGYKMTAGTNRSYDGIRNLSTTVNVTNDEIVQSASAGHSISWENTVAYNFMLKQLHTFDVVIGQSIEKWGMGEGLNGSGKNSSFPGSFKHAYLENANPTAMSEIAIGGDNWGDGAIASFFGRVNYNYNETYLASLTLRADGSSNFARGHRWGYFPSVSAGWVMTNEDFMKPLHDYGIDFFKLRASWGQNGNASIDPFQYLATIAFDSDNSYYFGDSKEKPTTGAYADILPNPNVSWETSEQLDLGFDSRFIDSRLGITFDWYRKMTKDWLVVAPQLASYGTGAPYINGGDIVNKGVELGITWNDHIGDFYYGVNLNVGYNKNEVVRIANSEGIIHGEPNVLSYNTTEMYRAQEGYPLGYFWGYQTEGIYQNQKDIDDRKALKKGMLSNAQPGDLIFSDTNKDGYITEEDKMMIGNPHPDVISGLTLTFGYKGFDLSLVAYGNFGHQIAKSYRSFVDHPLENYTTDIFKRWYGEDTSNQLPRLTSGNHTNWQYISDIYIENADFVKLSNLTLGYDFKRLFPKIPFGQARLYLTAQNLFTITGYSGMDPEVGYGGSTTDDLKHGNWASGIDIGYYPSPRSYIIGVNLKF